MESGQALDRITADVTTLTESRLAINYIVGSPSNDQYQSKRQQKKLLRAATVKARVNVIHMEGRHKETKSINGLISFPPVNPNRIIVPYYDALVLTLYINGFDVHRVLVDPNSVIDLLQLPAFKQMKFSLGILNSARRVLFGFNDVTTRTLGDVAFLVKARPVTHRVLFSIIEDLGPYNAIMGQVWLHSMKAIPSTYYQMVSYLTNIRQVDLLGSQLATRQCYQLSKQEKKGDKNLRNPSFEDRIPT